MTPGLPILTFHAVDDSGSVIATAPDRFRRILDALRDAGHRPIALDDWVAAGRPDAPGRFAVTFDDGLRSILSIAGRLAADNIPATVFLLAGRIGGDNRWPGQPAAIPPARLLDRAEVADLAAAGLRFGSHGLDHARMDRLDPDALDRELAESRDRVEQVTGQACRLLAYPYGATGPGVIRAARRHYDAAVTTRLAYASARDDVHALPRLDAFYLRSAGSVARLASGRWGGRLAARRVARAARGWVAERVGA